MGFSDGGINIRNQRGSKGKDVYYRCNADYMNWFEKISKTVCLDKSELHRFAIGYLRIDIQTKRFDRIMKDVNGFQDLYEQMGLFHDPEKGKNKKEIRMIFRLNQSALDFVEKMVSKSDYSFSEMMRFSIIYLRYNCELGEEEDANKLINKNQALFLNALKGLGVK